MKNISEITGRKIVNKNIFRLIVTIYVAICVFLNTSTFLEPVGGVYLFALLASLGVSILETKLAHSIGEAISLKQWLRASVISLVGSGLVLYLVSRQQDYGFGVIIILIFGVGVIFSFLYHEHEEQIRKPRLMLILTKKLAALKGKLVVLNEDHVRAQRQLSVLGKGAKDRDVKSLNTTIKNGATRLDQLSSSKEAELVHIENLERDAIAEIRRGYADFGDVA